MKYIKSKLLFAVLFFFILISCKDKLVPVSFDGLELPSDTVYNQIIDAIFIQDTLDLIHNNRKELKYLQSDLIKVKIKFHIKSDTLESTPFAPNYNTSIFELIYYGITDLKNLKADSLYFAFQNNSKSEFRIKGEYENYTKLTGADLDKRLRSQKYVTYLKISIPLLNCMQTKAFVRTNANCGGGECGEGILYILEKVNNKWMVKRMVKEWVS